MKKSLFAVFLFCAVVSVRAAEPSEQSINDMMKVVNVEGMLDQMLSQMETGMKAGMEDALKQAMPGKELTPAQRAAADNCLKKLSGAVKEELSFAKTKDIYFRVYRETFTQEEVSSIVAFYSSPGGKAMVEKIPAVMQKAGGLMQARIAPVGQKIQAMQAECMKEIQTAK